MLIKAKYPVGFLAVMVGIGLMLTGVMLFYAHKSDKLLRDYQNNNLTLNVEKTGWTLGYDADGHIIYRQNNLECRVK